jgi:hypothetical protein
MIISLGRSKVKIKALKKSWSERRFIGGESGLNFNSSLSLEKEILGLYPRFFHPSSLSPPLFFWGVCLKWFKGIKCVRV